MRKQNTWFSIIEVMIWLFVFALWLTSVFLMLSGSITMSDYSRNLIIASNLANEQVELYKNIRDSNYKKVKNWIQTDPSVNHNWTNIYLNEEYDATKFFKKDQYYKIENNYNAWAVFPILVQVRPFFDLEDDSLELPDEIEDFRLCLDPIWRYTYDCTGVGNEPTNFYRLLYLEEAEHDWNTLNVDPNKPFNIIRITSKVIWTYGSRFDTEISTIVTDWKKL